MQPGDLIQSQPRVGHTPNNIYRIALAGLSVDEILARDSASIPLSPHEAVSLQNTLHPRTS